MNAQPHAPVPELPAAVKALSTSAGADRTAFQMALQWYQANLAQHLACDYPLAVRRCATFIRFECGLTIAAADTLALQALGYHQGVGDHAVIDIDRSTSFVVFLRDPDNGREVAFTAAELARWSRVAADTPPHLRRPQS